MFLLNMTSWNYGIVKFLVKTHYMNGRNFALTLIVLLFCLFVLDKNLFRKLKQIKIPPLDNLS